MRLDHSILFAEKPATLKWVVQQLKLWSVTTR